ncbi:hypothetical protein MTO96_012191 [Rhipicephalus appendiculatus]
MCLLETACQIVTFGIFSLVKDIRLLRHTLEAPYYAVSVGLALWLILVVLVGNKPWLLQYIEAAKWQARVCFYWQLISFFVAAAHYEVRIEKGARRAYINWANWTWTKVTVTRTGGITISAAGVIAYVALLPIYYLRRFVIWRIEAYAATLPN